MTTIVRIKMRIVRIRSWGALPGVLGLGHAGQVIRTPSADANKRHQDAHYRHKVTGVFRARRSARRGSVSSLDDERAGHARFGVTGHRADHLVRPGGGREEPDPLRLTRPGARVDVRNALDFPVVEDRIGV